MNKIITSVQARHEKRLSDLQGKMNLEVREADLDSVNEEIDGFNR